jgi:hypothetical protein
MTTHTFISILAWPLVLFLGLVILCNLPYYLQLRVQPRGWIALLIFLLSLWWLTCN